MLTFIIILAFVSGIITSVRNKTQLNFDLYVFSELMMMATIEEVVFRQFLFYFFEDFYYEMTSAVLFGLIHFTNIILLDDYKVIVYQIFTTTFLGYYLAENYVIYKNLAYVIGIHVVYNLYVFSIAYSLSENQRKESTVYIRSRRNSVDSYRNDEIINITNDKLVKIYNERTEKIGNPFKYLKIN